ncbi:phage major capsid protein, HK97 family [Pseudonocardia ammonioxydans]|uniref:Phage major capsid protein, HK97 family n=1 Tax=Pseudonocardia ammonioxydans TaxID=260086 RepID=A0A1I5HWK7_PSUAM|nr:phage major capsid protein [Pseudonocardia ammonioxydans]SFO52675.1 phage major capsid protein, HK97 family [Pseudonocardia ammonioxydans]
MPSPLINTLRERRRRVYDDAKSLADLAAAENRAFTDDEQTRWAALNDELDTLDQRLTDLREQDQRAGQSEAAFANLLGGAVQTRSAADTDLDARFRAAILENDRRPIVVANPCERSGYRPGVERRDLATTSGGGLLPTSFFDRIQRHMVESSAILAAGATMLNSRTGEPIKIPRSTAHSAAAIVTEGGTITEDDPTLGSVTLGAYKYGFLVQITHELATDATFDLLAYLGEQAGIAIGNAFGAHAITGTGTGQPRGVLTDATAGKTGDDTTGGTFTADELIDLYYSLAEPYARSAAAGWLMNTSTLGAIRKLKASGTGDYLFANDVPAGTGAAGTLLGRPVYLDPTMPDVGVGAKCIAFGDWSRYWVRQVEGLRFERSDDFAFDRDVVTFRALARLDGALVDTTGAVKVFEGGSA